MDFTFTVDASVERTEGKFESRDTIEAALLEALDSANPGDIEGDNGGRYEVASWEVEAKAAALRSREPKPAPAPAPQPTPFVPIIRAYVKLQHYNDVPDSDDLDYVKIEIATEELTKALDALVERFPNVAAMEKAKLAAEGLTEATAEVTKAATRFNELQEKLVDE